MLHLQTRHPYYHTTNSLTTSYRTNFCLLTFALVTNFSSLEDGPRQGLAAHITIGGGVNNYLRELVPPHIDHILHNTHTHTHTHARAHTHTHTHTQKKKNRCTYTVCLYHKQEMGKSHVSTNLSDQIDHSNTILLFNISPVRICTCQCEGVWVHACLHVCCSEGNSYITIQLFAPILF